MKLMPNGEPEVITKPETPFYKSPKFLVAGVGLVLIIVFLAFLLRIPSQTQKIAKMQ